MILGWGSTDIYFVSAIYPTFHTSITDFRKPSFKLTFTEHDSIANFQRAGCLYDNLFHHSLLARKAKMCT